MRSVSSVCGRRKASGRKGQRATEACVATCQERLAVLPNPEPKGNLRLLPPPISSPIHIQRHEAHRPLLGHRRIPRQLHTNSLVSNHTDPFLGLDVREQPFQRFVSSRTMICIDAQARTLYQLAHALAPSIQSRGVPRLPVRFPFRFLHSQAPSVRYLSLSRQLHSTLHHLPCILIVCRANITTEQAFAIVLSNENTTLLPLPITIVSKAVAAPGLSQCSYNVRPDW